MVMVCHILYSIMLLSILWLFQLLFIKLFSHSLLDCFRKELKLGSSKENVNVVVAVNRLMNDAEPDTQEAFEKEIQFMSHLNHNNVVH